MKKKLKRTVLVTFCDQCKKEMTPPYSTFTKNGKEYHLHSSSYSDTGKRLIKTCLEKFTDNPPTKP